MAVETEGKEQWRIDLESLPQPDYDSSDPLSLLMFAAKFYYEQGRTSATDYEAGILEGMYHTLGCFHSNEERIRIFDMAADLRRLREEGHPHSRAAFVDKLLKDHSQPRTVSASLLGWLSHSGYSVEEIKEVAEQMMQSACCGDDVAV